MLIRAQILLNQAPEGSHPNEDRAYQGFAELAGRAQSAGKLRADFVPEDLVSLLMANAGL